MDLRSWLVVVMLHAALAAADTAEGRSPPSGAAGLTRSAPREEPSDSAAEEAQPESLVADAAPAEQAPASASADGGFLYTADLSDDELARRWADEPASLGSISVGLAEAGRLINGVQVEPGEAWTVVDPRGSWGTQETVEALRSAATTVALECPGSDPLRVNHLSLERGGFLRPHQSHQAGLDADLGFYYRRDAASAGLKKDRQAAMDLEANWALVRALVTESDVQVILLDHRVQKTLYDHAVAQGENRAWLDGLFRAGRASLFQHARRHRDHFHVRFYAPRSQELGRRLQPLMAKRADENLAVHRVTQGDTLGRIAQRYGSSVALISRANGLASSLLQVGRTLRVPLRGPCTHCPLTPRVVVPPRRLPPQDATASRLR